MNQTRYIYKAIPLSPEEAQELRNREIQSIKWQIEGLEEELRHAKNRPLDVEKAIQIELNPGDDGYEDAPFEMNPIMYQGTTIWLNQTSASTPPTTA